MRKFLEQIFGSSTTGTDDARSAEFELQIATTALLLETAKADFDFTDEERQVVINNLERFFDIDADYVKQIIKVSREEVAGRHDYYHFTRLINDHFDKDEKIKIVEMIWRVIFADSKLDGHEDQIAHKFSRLLKLDHPDLIEAKLRVKRESESGD